MSQQPNQQQIQIKISDEDMKGFYSNLMQIVHSKEEFIFDFANVMGQQGVVGSRIFMSPGHAKRILAALTENLKKYEEQFGTINEGSSPAQNSEFGFTNKS
jgi:hypothetical protein